MSLQFSSYVKYLSKLFRSAILYLANVPRRGIILRMFDPITRFQSLLSGTEYFFLGHHNVQPHLTRL